MKTILNLTAWNGNKWKHQTKDLDSKPNGITIYVSKLECYLSTRHSPIKVYFAFDYRAFSHGCINMDKAKELVHI
jgi:hypothetical protein